MEHHRKDDSSTETDTSLEFCTGHSDAFPVKLHKMLEQLEREGNQHIISWNPDGTTFSIHKPKVFAQNIMGRFFNQTKYKSFQRQLNIYNFERLIPGKGIGHYRHDYFVRANIGLCHLIRRGKQHQMIRLRPYHDTRPHPPVLAINMPMQLAPREEVPVVPSHFQMPTTEPISLGKPPVSQQQETADKATRWTDSAITSDPTTVVTPSTVPLPPPNALPTGIHLNSDDLDIPFDDGIRPATLEDLDRFVCDLFL